MGRRGGRRGYKIYLFVSLSAVAAALLYFVYFSRVLVPSFKKPPESFKPPLLDIKKELLPERPFLRPVVAIVIDDMGADLNALNTLLEIKAPITVAILPHLKHTKEVSRQAHINGLEVILHLPMEPKDSSDGRVHDPGMGVLLTAMSAEAVKRQILEDLKEVSEAVGVNNHMGSRFTEDESLMRALLEVIRENNLYFLDSKTTAGSVAMRLAKDMGVRNAGRSVFLDNSRDKEYIKRQIKALARIAKKRGSAIAIGHPYPETLDVLKESVTFLEGEGIEVVRLSRLAQ